MGDWISVLIVGCRAHENTFTSVWFSVSYDWIDCAIRDTAIVLSIGIGIVGAECYANFVGRICEVSYRAIRAIDDALVSCRVFQISGGTS